MNLETIIMGTAGAALLLGAGALFRSPIRRRGSEPPSPPNSVPGQDDEAVAALRSRLAECEAAQDKTLEETVDMRQRLERHVEAAEADARRIASEMEAHKSRATELEQALEASRQEVEAAHGKAEALERLVEGVRARSRELADELKKREQSG